MLVLFIGCVFQFSLIKDSLSNQIQPKHLEVSLKDVNTLLADLDDEIAVERELLSQIDETDYAAAQGNSEIKLNLDPPPFIERELEESAHEGDNKYSPPTDESHVTWQPRDMLTWPSAKDTKIVPDKPVLQNEWALEDPFGQATKSVNPVTITKLTTKVTRYQSQTPGVNIDLYKHPFRRSIVKFMNEENVKYVCAFAVAVFTSMARKTGEDVKVILEAFATTAIRMVDKNELICYNKVLQGRVKDVATMALKLEPTLFIKMCKAFLIALRHRLNTVPDGIVVLKCYDQLFNIEEGNQLLDIVVAVDNYNVKDYGKPLAMTLAEKCIRVLVAPVIRQCGSPQVQDLINKVNVAYEKRFLSERPMPENIALALMERGLTSDTLIRRSIGKTYKHVKSEYKKMIRHYILKHPTIFRTFAKHYKQSKERKRRRLKHKNHRNSHHKRHRHSHKHHYGKQSKSITKQQARNETTAHTTKKLALFRGISNVHQTSKVQKRYNIVEKLPRNLLEVSPNVLYRRNEMKIPQHMKQNVSNDLSREFPSTKIFSNNNTILEKIIGESSYSDDEIYLKTMLKDAFFHGNH